jgi:single-strand DNA-binding protein
MPEIGVNKVILIGRTGADAELRYISSGKAVANFSLAVNESYKNGDGEQREHVEWIRCVAWGRLAEVAAEFLTKGKQLSGAHDNCFYAEHAIMGSKQVGTAV